MPDSLYLNDINVLGAGDYFVASFIDSIFSGENERESAINSHKKTTFLLKNR